MDIQDDRTDEQRVTHDVIIGGIDRGMSGWGKAENGLSYCGWACEPEHVEAVTDWVCGRSDISRVGARVSNWKPRGVGHCHIYMVTDGHPALCQAVSS